MLLQASSNCLHRYFLPCTNISSSKFHEGTVWSIEAVWLRCLYFYFYFILFYFFLLLLIVGSWNAAQRTVSPFWTPRFHTFLNDIRFWHTLAPTLLYDAILEAVLADRGFFKFTLQPQFSKRERRLSKSVKL